MQNHKNPDESKSLPFYWMTIYVQGQGVIGNTNRKEFSLFTFRLY